MILYGLYLIVLFYFYPNSFMSARLQWNSQSRSKVCVTNTNRKAEYTKAN